MSEISADFRAFIRRIRLWRFPKKHADKSALFYTPIIQSALCNCRMQYINLRGTFACKYVKWTSDALTRFLTRKTVSFPLCKFLLKVFFVPKRNFPEIRSISSDGSLNFNENGTSFNLSRIQPEYAKWICALIRIRLE